MYRKSCCITPDVWVAVEGGGGISKMLKSYLKIFFVIGKQHQTTCPVRRHFMPIREGIFPFQKKPEILDSSKI